MQHIDKCLEWLLPCKRVHTAKTVLQVMSLVLEYFTVTVIFKKRCKSANVSNVANLILVAGLFHCRLHSNGSIKAGTDSLRAQTRTATLESAPESSPEASTVYGYRISVQSKVHN